MCPISRPRITVQAHRRDGIGLAIMEICALFESSLFDTDLPNLIVIPGRA
jgi:hypothetical protein